MSRSPLLILLAIALVACGAPGAQAPTAMVAAPGGATPPAATAFAPADTATPAATATPRAAPTRPPRPTATQDPLLPTAPPRITPGPTAAPAPLEAGWWDSAVCYEVFVRSFYDSDGIGDLGGLTFRLTPAP